jgi:uroporphyrin-III C-methyltransferase/precorrin-2 dehydrogenase/sirohydrochlorin ferrochelatase
MDVLQQLPSDGPLHVSPRMAPLAKLPVFFQLKGERVLVAGGSEGAAWKAELLAAAGAEVHIYAEDVCDTLADLVAGNCRYRLYRHSWQEQSFAGVALAIGDFDSETHARCFFQAARSAGVPVNVIDKPEFCQFQFGSIVNRSPVVVSISTDGAAPILAQAIRRRIEAVLPASLGNWAAIAAAIRERVIGLLKPGAERRSFWEGFVDRAFREKAPKDADTLLDAALGVVLRKDAGGNPGHVTLVGVGSQDAELLTLKAIRALQAADVILFDSFICEAILELARREARRVPIADHFGHSNRENVGSMLEDIAKAGKRVVWLKSGDPRSIANVADEIFDLEDHGITVDVIPATAAIDDMTALFRGLPLGGGEPQLVQ